MNINFTLVGQMISFAVFVWFCMRFVWPPIMQAMRERESKIAEGLAAAERGVHQQEVAERDAEEKLKEARNKANEIVASAEKRGVEMLEQAKHHAREEGERIKNGAQAEIERQVHAAREELRRQVSQLAIAAAERILKREIDAKQHASVLDDLAKQI